MKASISGLSLLAISVATSGVLGSVQYVVTDLDIPSGSIASAAKGINSSGEIVGYYLDSTGTSHALFWPNRTAPSTSLPAQGSTQSQASNINDSGLIAGSYSNSATTSGCVWTNVTHTPTTLQAPSGATIYTGSGINNSGQVTGYYRDINYLYHACFWGGSSTAATKLADFPSAVQVFASDIDNAGRIVGDFQDSTSAVQACTWASSSAVPTTLAILVGTAASMAAGINSSGQIVGGYSTTSGNLDGEHACIWNGDTVTDLNTLISPASGWTLAQANAINDSGWIVGWGTFNGSDNHAFLLTPVPPAPLLTVAGKRKLVAHRSTIVIHGSASGAVTSVTYQIGKRTRTAKGTTIWKFTAKLGPGKNKIVISSHGPGGSSPTIKVIVIRA